MGRNYKDEYKKFQDSPAQKKKRAALNRENHNRGTYGNGDGLDVSHTKNGIKLEKSSINKGRKEKSRMVGSKRKKQKGGYLSGPSHKNGGIPAVVAGKQPVELEGGEYIIKKSSVDKLGKKTLEEINKKGRIPTMKKGGNTNKFLEAGEDTIKNAWGQASDSLKKVYGNDYNAFLSAVKTKQKNIKGYKGGDKKTKGDPTSEFKGVTSKMPIKKKLTKEQKDAGWTYGGQKTQTDSKNPEVIKKTNDKSKTEFLEGQKNLEKEFGDSNKSKVEKPKEKPKKKYDFSKPGIREARRKERRRAGVQERLKKAKPIKRIEARKDKSGPLTKTSDLMKKVKGKDQITFKKTSPATKFEQKMRKEKKYGKKSKFRDLAQKAKNRLNKLRTKFQAGGPVQKPMGANQVNPSAPYNPTSNIPARPPFRQGMRMMGHGGVVSTSNDKATAGDIHTTHTHSGYKAGE